MAQGSGIIPPCSGNFPLDLKLPKLQRACPERFGMSVNILYLPKLPRLGGNFPNRAIKNYFYQRYQRYQRSTLSTPFYAFNAIECYNMVLIVLLTDALLQMQSDEQT